MAAADWAGEVSLGLGLISIGRQWGVRPVPLPSAAEAGQLLDAALASGIRLFDTAPSYGSSENRLGAWLGRLAPEQRAGVTVATKCGEHWDPAAEAPFTDHSFDALRRSIDRSFERLGRVDLLQIHKATPPVLGAAGVRRALEYAAARGVPRFGVSASDAETARIAVADPFFSAVQIFFNSQNAGLEEIFPAAEAAGKRLLVNRPFAMGRLLYGDDGRERDEQAMVDAFRFILARPFRGAVLTGTRSVEHLRANLSAFESARKHL